MPTRAYFGTDLPEEQLLVPVQQPEEGWMESMRKAYEQMMRDPHRGNQPDFRMPDVNTLTPQERKSLLDRLAEHAATDGEVQVLDDLAKLWGVESPYGPRIPTPMPEGDLERLRTLGGRGNAYDTRFIDRMLDDSVDEDTVGPAAVDFLRHGQRHATTPEELDTLRRLSERLGYPMPDTSFDITQPVGKLGTQDATSFFENQRREEERNPRPRRPPPRILYPPDIQFEPDRPGRQ